MSDQEFMELVGKVLDTMPERIAEKMNNVAIVVEDGPTPEQLRDGRFDQHEPLFGLYEGTPLSMRGVDGVMFPDKVTIFKNTILGAYSDPKDIAACVANTVWHEIAHHFGWDEEWIAREEERRGKTL